jgi:choice-of-anchor A domain-containing protein
MVVPLDPLDGGAQAWAQTTTVSTSRVPLDFDLVTFGDAQGLRTAEGPIAVGSDANFSDFAINGVANASTGLVIGGTFTGSQGSIRGGVSYRKNAPNLNNVSVSGAVAAGLPFDFGRVKHELGDLGAALAKRGPTGTTKLNGFALELRGRESDLNVFSVTAEQLAQAGTLSINVPSSTSVLINVVGKTITVGASVQLTGTSASRVLWNPSQATHITVASADFLGSLLAPDAAVQLGSGDIRGTIVAESVVGPARLRHAPLSSWTAFGVSPELTTSVSFTPNRPLYLGCNYKLVILATTPTNRSGSCLAEPFTVDFKVADSDTAPLKRETVRETRRFRDGVVAPVAFEALPGVNSLLEGVFDRYAETLGLRPGLDRLVRAPGGQSPLDPTRATANFRQEYRGIPVDGYGYLVEHDNELFRSAKGRLLSDITLDIAPGLSSSQAITAALDAAEITERPWNQTPPAAPPPTTSLVIVARSTLGVVPPPRLAWRVRLSGIARASSIDVDAQTGELLTVLPAMRRALPPVSCVGFDPAVATPSGNATDEAVVTFSSSLTQNRDNLKVGIWSQAGTEYRALFGDDPIELRTEFLDANIPPGPSNADNIIEYACLTPSDAYGRQMASVHWSVQAAVRSFGEFLYGSTAWYGMRGTVSYEVPIIAQLLVPTGDTTIDNPNDWVTQYRGWTDSPPPEERLFVTIEDELFASTAHEFAHGVLQNSRFRAGAPALYAVAEAGALDEAYGDIMAAVTTRREAADVDIDPWCMPAAAVDGGGCERNLANPKASDGLQGVSPDTYGGTRWFDTSATCDTNRDNCGVHRNSTVISHWFYTLVHGRSVMEVNDRGCGVSVVPLDSDLDVALDMAGQIVFTAFAALPATADLIDARVFTADTAQRLYGVNAARTVEQAWLGVGVGEAPVPGEIFPEDRAEDEDPWFSSVLGWEVYDQVGPWVARYSTREDFSNSFEIEFDESNVFQDPDGRRFISKDVAFPAGETIHWQGREGLPGGDSAWTSCAAFSASFETKTKEIEFSGFAEGEVGEFLQVGPNGTLVFKNVLGADGYDVRLTRSVADCDENDATFVDAVGPPLIALGNTIHEDSQDSLRDPVFISPDLDIDPERTYHLYIRAFNEEGGGFGSCAHIPFRKAKLLPFELLSPVHELGGPFPNPPYDSGGPFIWTPSEGVEYYQLDIYRNDGIPGNPIYLMTTEFIDGPTAPLNTSGEIEYTLQDKSSTKTSGQYFWLVRAFGSGYSRVGWTELESSFGSTAVFIPAAEKAFLIQGRFGTSWSPGDTSALLVSVPAQGARISEFTFASLHNTDGFFWWLGRWDQVPGDGGYQIAYNQVDNEQEKDLGYAYTGEIEIPEVQMRLVVYPFSTIFDTGYGLGPVADIAIETYFCGGPGETCCEHETCFDGTPCTSGYCQGGCGHSGEPCCEQGRGCVMYDNHQTLMCLDNGTCSYCGTVNQKCCDNLDFPCPGSDDLFCDDELGTCSLCGHDDKPCCPGNSCAYSSPGYSCHSGTCSRDTTPGQNTAPSTRMCSGVDRATDIPLAAIEVGANDGAHFEVDVGGNNGYTWLYVNTLNVPDALIVKYENEDMVRTGCVSTEFIAGYDNPVTGWSCDDVGGWCKVRLRVEGASSVLSVDVQPNCAGTTDTLWSFALTCMSN